MVVSSAPEPFCECGSGLTTARCCALDLTTSAVQEPASPGLQLLEDRAVAALQSGAPNTAETLALEVLELAPHRIPALSVLYTLRKSQAAAAAAQALIRRIVALDPNNFWAVNELTLLLLGKGALADAELHARNAIRIAPDNAQAHYLMGMVLTEAFRPGAGEYHYHRAIELSGARDPVVLANLALCLKNQGKMAAARALYQQSLTASPERLHTLLGAASLEEADRNLDAATVLLDRAGALFPNNSGVRLLQAVVLRRQGNTEGALALLDGMAADKTELGTAELLEKGRLLDKMGRYDEAFDAYDDGKTRLRLMSGNAYLAEQARHGAGRQRRFFTARRMRRLPRAQTRTDVAQPIFVLGFPRSGTTLLEQMLTAHPRIAAGDELPFVKELTQLIPRMLDSPLDYPEALVELWMGDHLDDLDTLRDHYLRKVAKLGIVAAGQTWFTDKMPLNETEIGLISMLFPAAPLLHLTRHPLDVVLSVFSNLLTHGQYCAYALQTAAEHYVLVMDLVDHYRSELDLRYLAVRYEDVVDDAEAALRRIMAFIGEEFDPACLSFTDNRRYARTASYAQVSEPLYERSRYRYRNYLARLEPVIPILEPVIERLGYKI